MSRPIEFLPADQADAFAIKAVAEGTADLHMQQRAFKCIVQELCGTYEMTFDPESIRKSDFNEGRRHIGRALVGIVNLPSEVLKQGYANLERRDVAISKVTKGKRHVR